MFNLISMGGDSTPYKVYNPILGPAPDKPVRVAFAVPEEHFDGEELTPEGLIWVAEYMQDLCQRAWKRAKGE